MAVLDIPVRHYIVTGCAGFIGSHVVDRLLALGCRVTGIDNFSTGQRRFIEQALAKPNFVLYELDLLNQGATIQAFAGGDCVIHLAAHADVRSGVDHPQRDLQQNTLVTLNVLEAMRAQGISQIAFSSTGSIYGDTAVIPTPEDAPFPVQTSLYGASKLAAEGLITAYCEAFGFKAWILRFVSILGERYTHGHIFDFYRQLKANPQALHVLGDGQQRKSYLYVHDCIDALLLVMAQAQDKVNIFNLGVDGYCKVNDSIQWMCESLEVSPTLTYAGGARGWVGDNPFIFLDTRRIRALGWKPSLEIADGVRKTVEFLRQNEWLLKARS